MDVKEKLNMDIEGLVKYGPINIVAFGDSVTHGALLTGNNYETVYWNLLKQKLNAVRDSIPVNVIDAGIGGITAKDSVDRMESQVLSHNPDLVIICFGLNDVNGTLDDYINSLKIMFGECKKHGTDVIFMTPNMLNTYVADDTLAHIKDYAAVTAEYQNSGRMDEYMSAAIEAAREADVKICDCYGEWKKLYEKGIDTTMLLINRINHPTQKMHHLFADMLFDTIMGTEEFVANEYVNTMYRDK